MQRYDFEDEKHLINLDLQIQGSPQKVILIVSPCRSGGTALLGAFSMGGAQGVFQPIKTALRRYLVGMSEPVLIKADKPFLVIKEALGPYISPEIHYNPLAILRNKGVNVRAISLVTLLRQPEDCLISWRKSFSRSSFKNFEPTLFADAYEATLELLNSAQSEGIPAIALCNEDFLSPDILQDMMNYLGVPFAEEMIDWKKSSYYQHGSYPFQKPEEPPEFQVSGLLDGIKYGVGLGLPVSNSVDHRPLIDEELSKIAGLPRALEVFCEYKKKCSDQNIGEKYFPSWRAHPRKKFDF